MFFTAVEALVLLVALFTVGYVEYFTWWGIGAFVASSVTTVFTTKHTWITDIALVVSTTIVFAVPLCSMSGCTLFEETKNANNIFVYVAGNTVLHYWPALRLMKRLTHHKCTDFLGTRFLLLYLTLVDVSVTYSCVIPAMPMAICAVMLSLTVDACLVSEGNVRVVRG
jgi:hypothetical protein